MSTDPKDPAAPSQGYRIAALYRFAPVADPARMKAQLIDLGQHYGACGTLILAEEGINGTVAASPEALPLFLEAVQKALGFDALPAKFADSNSKPFGRFKVKVKPEIVTLRAGKLDPNAVSGERVSPEQWNALIQDPAVRLIDMRNSFEFDYGHFQGAEDPGTVSFAEFPDYADRALDPSKDNKIAMYCTGGIRCEKSTAYLKSQGFEEVYHLQGGILKYLEEMPEDETLWEGECYVFDERVSVNHKLEKGEADQCHACRRPISEEDKASEKYQPGLSCPQCHDDLSEEQRARFAERMKQLKLAKARGEEHIGYDAAEIIEKRRKAKYQKKDVQRSK